MRGASLLAVVAVLALTSEASGQTVPGGIVSNGTFTAGGTGLGAVNTVLTLQSPGSTSVESGCISPSGTSNCGFANANVQNGQSQTVFLSALSGVNGSNLGVVLNFAEPGNALEGQLDQLVLTLYSNAGTSLFSTSLAGSVFYPSTFVGTGNSGFLFSFTPTAAAGFDAAVRAGGTQVGLGAALSQVTGGQETFYLTVNANVAAVPEPASMVLLGTGLLGVFGAARRRRKTT